MVDIAKIVGDRIRIIRTEKGLTQEELAHRAEIDPSHFGKMERGEVNPSLNSLEKITNVLEITLEDLFRNIQPSTANKDNTTISLLINKLNTLTVKEQKLILTLLDILFKLMKHKA
jgi:transcriptional regulator with XRE-family HTH domain